MEATGARPYSPATAASTVAKGCRTSVSAAAAVINLRVQHCAEYSRACRAQRPSSRVSAINRRSLSLSASTNGNDGGANARERPLKPSEIHLRDKPTDKPAVPLAALTQFISDRETHVQEEKAATAPPAAGVPCVAPAVLPQLAFEGSHNLKAGILTVTCPDSAGIIGTVTSFLHMHGANIEDCQSNSTSGSIFTMRVHFSLPENWLGVVREAFGAMIAGPYKMQWNLRWEDEMKKVAVLCTKEDHALMEILWAVVREDLRCQVTAVVSNHPDLQKATESLGFPFHHVVVNKDRKDKAEKEILSLLGGADLVVLARYMQILSPEFISAVGVPIVNIHHSFLPAFKGANPYRQAHEKGVRLIGATAHYVTAELDQGPIIEQDVARVSHRLSVQDFRAMGRNVESKVLHRAVKWHLEDRVFLVEGNKTVVFD